MTTALIGHTGFVGGALDRAGDFDQHFNSANFTDLAGKEFDLVVCAGIASVKWLANKEPEEDRRGIKALTDVLEHARIGEFILISTIDVYSDPACKGDETTAIPEDGEQAYGRNRHALERWARARFERCRIIRLSALYGHGLKKNALYDLMHGHMLDRINPAGIFQWYGVDRLWADIEICRAHDLGLVNLVTEPLALARIIERCFADVPTGPAANPAPVYDMRTVHSGLFGGGNGYVTDAGTCLDRIARFVETAKGR